MGYDGIIWDMDGTLLDTLQDLHDSVNHVLRQNDLPERTMDEIRAFVGNGVGRLMERSVPGGRTRPDFPALMAQFSDHYARHCNDNTHIYPGVEPVLRRLKAMGKRMAIVSNKPEYGVQALTKQYFADLMDAAIGESADVRRKPAPDAVITAMARLGAAPERSVYIGDSDVDIETAHNAGLDCISVTWGFRSRSFLLEHGARVLADTPEELLALLTKEA